jgi:hypothetical protein
MENGSNQDPKANDQSKAAGGDEKEKFVARSAYEEVSKDMHKYKSQAKEAAAKAAELEAKILAAEEAKMQDEKRFEELYQKEKEARERAETALKSTDEHYKKSVKMTALMRELGGNIKPKYLQHAALDEIVVRDDGTLSSESVTAVANKFRQENPELVPTQNAGNMNDQAPGSNTPSANPLQTLDNMTQAEKRALLASKRTQSSKVGLAI